MSLRTLRLFLIVEALLIVHVLPARLAANPGGNAGDPFLFPSTSEGSATPPATGGISHPPSVPQELPLQVLRDQRFFWSRPFRMKRKDLPWLGLMVGTTAGLVAIDRRVGQRLTDSPPGNGYAISHNIARFGGPGTDLGIAGAIYLSGLRSGDPYTKSTGLLGIEAVTDSWVVVELAKISTQRPRPTFSGGAVRDHNADGQFFAGGTSFPSGHAAAAFALATVVSERDRDRPWVAPVAYGLASMVSVSRLTARAHFPSDVFVGAALGFLMGRHVVHHAEQPKPDSRFRTRLLPQVSAAGNYLTLSWDL